MVNTKFNNLWISVILQISQSYSVYLRKYLNFSFILSGLFSLQLVFSLAEHGNFNEHLEFL